MILDYKFLALLVEKCLSIVLPKCIWNLINNCEQNCVAIFMLMRWTHYNLHSSMLNWFSQH